MDPIEDIINRYYNPGDLAREVLVRHSEAVAGLSVRIAERLRASDPAVELDTQFIAEAAMLHDIGILYTDSPSIGCYGDHAYICHGHLGRRLLEANGLPAHARVCETHVGVGLSRAEIIAQKLPLPHHDMRPQSLEEQIICFADTFFSKTPPPHGRRHTAADVIRSLEKYGRGPVEIFENWLAVFGCPEDRHCTRAVSSY